MTAETGPETARTTGPLETLAIGAAIAVSLTLAIGLSAAPRRDDSFLAIFPPWWSEARIFGAAVQAGDVAAVGARPFLLTLRSPTPGLARRLHVAGALLLLDPSLAGVCAAPSSGSRS